MRRFLIFIHIICAFFFVLAYLFTSLPSLKTSVIYCFLSGFLLWLGFGLFFQVNYIRIISIIFYLLVFCTSSFYLFLIFTAKHLESPGLYLILIFLVSSLSISIFLLICIIKYRFVGEKKTEYTFLFQLSIWLFPTLLFVLHNPHKHQLTKYRMNILADQLETSFDYKKIYESKKLETTNLNDAWGTKIQYKILKSAYIGIVTIWSSGPDKELKTKDDIKIKRRVHPNNRISLQYNQLRIHSVRYTNSPEGEYFNGFRVFKLSETDHWKKPITIVDIYQNNKRVVIAISNGEDGLIDTQDDIVFGGKVPDSLIPHLMKSDFFLEKLSD